MSDEGVSVLEYVYLSVAVAVTVMLRVACCV